MELIALVVFGIPCAIAAAVVALLLRWRKWLPAGVGPVRFGGILWSILIGGFFAQSYIDEMVVRPWRIQAAHLGGQYGTPLTLRRYRVTGFQDLLFETSYQLSQAQAAKLRTRCGAPTYALGYHGCTLYSWQGGEHGDESMVILLSPDNQLHIVEAA